MSETIKAIIIDDEPRARTLLKGLLAEYCKDVEVLADCENLPKGVLAIRKYKPQLVFLDIEMPGHSGLELLDFFDEQEVHFSIIFTTAYNQYAIQAFKLSAIDYLLKPIEPSELEEAIKRFRKRERVEKADYALVRESFRNMGGGKIAVPVGNGMKFIEMDQIVMLKADNSYTEMLLADESKLIVSRILKNFEDAFSGRSQFFRAHKSYIVNTAYITDYVKSDGGYLMLKQKYEVPISQDKVQDFLALNLFVKR